MSTIMKDITYNILRSPTSCNGENTQYRPRNLTRGNLTYPISTKFSTVMSSLKKQSYVYHRVISQVQNRTIQSNKIKLKIFHS